MFSSTLQTFLKQNNINFNLKIATLNINGINNEKKANDVNRSYEL